MTVVTVSDSSVIRDIAEIPAPPIAVRVVAIRPSRIELRSGGRTIACAYKSDNALAGNWMVDLSLPGVTSSPAFVVTSKSEAIDALVQGGYIYVAAKTGELK